VSNIGSSGKDGVSINLPQTFEWTANGRMNPNQEDGGAQLTAGGQEGEDIASLTISDSPRAATMSLAPRFDSLNFRLQIFNGDVPVLSDDLRTGVQAVSMVKWICEQVPEFCEFTWGFRMLPNGACEWDIGIGRPITMTTAHGDTVTGDRIVMTEIVALKSASGPEGNGHVGFDEMRIQVNYQFSYIYFVKRRLPIYIMFNTVKNNICKRRPVSQ